MLYVLPLIACAKALAKTLSGEDTAVHYGVMPVTVKTPFCPIVLTLAPKNLPGSWKIEKDSENVKALFYDKDNKLRAYALTGNKVKEKSMLNKLLPPILH